jgi:hypothetical protein
MKFKEEYRKLFNSVKEHRRAQGLPSKNEDIAKVLGYNRSYFSNLLGARGIVTEEHIKDMKLHFPFLLGNVTKEVPEEREPLETAIENLSESKLIDSKNIARLITLLEMKLGVQPDLSMFPKEGTPATENLRKKKTAIKDGSE